MSRRPGQGIPLLCLHTAGSDARQYRGLMNDARITANFRVIAFDMPWHGKSSPPAGWQDEEYQLTSRDYVRMILEVADALGLDKPVAMGCSIGGRIVLHLAHEHPERFRALIGLESAAHTAALLRPELAQPARRARRHGLRRRGLRAGRADRAGAERWETLWHYMQSGPGVFKGDLHFYMVDGDIRGQRRTRSTSSAARCSCSPANTTIPAPARPRSTSPSAPARRPPS